MSANKYADLPDIDTAPDLYETEDAYPASQVKNADSSDDEKYPSRSKNKQEVTSREELDVSNLLNPEEASAKFRKAEKARRNFKTQYAYPPSPTESISPTEGDGRSLSSRLRALEAELHSLESELADPSNPLIQKEREEQNVDPGELIRGLVDVRSRLHKIKKGKEGRARLVGAILESEGTTEDGTSTTREEKETKREDKAAPPKTELQTMVDLDKRVGQLEGLVGASSTALDESSPIPPPLLPQVTRLNNQLTILSQPRHIDAISRRLKLLLSDLERVSAAQAKAHARNGSTVSPIHSVQDQLLPIINRLTPLLPHIPHILARLRSLSTLHTSAAEFQSNLAALEEQQIKLRSTLQQLDNAVRTVEESLDANRTVVKENVAGLESRVANLLSRLEDLHHE